MKRDTGSESHRAPALRKEDPDEEEKQRSERSARTVFVAAAPPLLSAEQLAAAFAEAFGAVEEVREKVVTQASVGALARRHKRKSAGAEANTAAQRPTTTSAVRLLHFVFSSAQAVASLLEAAHRIGPECGMRSDAAQTSLRAEPTGVARWLREAGAASRTPAALQRDVDAFMANFDLKKEIERQRLKQQQRTDADGFTLVLGASATAEDGTTVRAARRAPATTLRSAGDSTAGEATNLFSAQHAATLSGEAAAETAAEGSRRKKKRKRGGVEEDFYRFQRREKRRQEFLNVQKALLADTKAVEEMEKANKFTL